MKLTHIADAEVIEMNHKTTSLLLDVRIKESTSMLTQIACLLS